MHNALYEWVMTKKCQSIKFYNETLSEANAFFKAIFGKSEYLGKIFFVGRYVGIYKTLYTFILSIMLSD